MTSMCRVHGSKDDLKIAYTKRLLPSSTLSVERNRHRVEIDEEETAKLDAAAGYGDMDTTGAALDCVGLIERRFGQEGWTTRDIDDAFLQPKLQASLLSYRSSRDEYTYRYINSTPSDCEHSCAPWNDTHALKGHATFRKSHAMELESRRTASTHGLTRHWGWEALGCRADLREQVCPRRVKSSHSSRPPVYYSSDDCSPLTPLQLPPSTSAREPCPSRRKPACTPKPIKVRQPLLRRRQQTAAETFDVRVQRAQSMAFPTLTKLVA